ncbi:hypothetical protein [Pseudomonas entomophila]|uniref:hypothetical protein n=1 Tax=Pseudomonas entomophila TaxID=312306 RepID=UPI001F018A30|nr:hypothetical protein [Pseudomonas entomophila]MCG8291381.1 hypothetical protein [Pseudomonas entomophila]
MTTSRVCIGQSANLVDGLNPHWTLQQGLPGLLYPVPEQPLATRPARVIEPRGTWSFPELSLHENALSLLDALIPLQVVSPSSEVDAPCIGAGALLAGAQHSHSSLQALSNTLGVSLDDEGLRYVLVKLTRVDGTDTHASAANGILMHVRPSQPDPAYGLTPAFLSSATKLAHAGRSRRQDYGEQLTVLKAQGILDTFGVYGTHYVSAVTLGDTILQVFAYRTEAFARIRQAYANGRNPLSGPNTHYFDQFTTDSTVSPLGYVAQYGKLLCLSDCSAFKLSVQKGDWVDPLWSHQSSIFAPFISSTALTHLDLADKFVEQTTVHVQLASLALMVEQKRGLLWQRIFKGAMVQKYRDRIGANFAVYDTRDFSSLLPEDTQDVVSFIATPNINLFKAQVDLATLQLIAPQQVRGFTLLANVLSMSQGAAVDVPGDQVRLFGQVIDMRTQGQPRAIRLSNDAYSTLQLSCDEFLGALAISDHQGDRYSVIVDGLRFGLRGDGPRAQPFIESDVRGTPASDCLPALIDNLEFSMSFAEAALCDRSSSSATGLQTLIKQYLSWLTELLPGDSKDERTTTLRVSAMDLLRCSDDARQESYVPLLPFDDYKAYTSSIIEYLERIQLQIAQNEQRLANRKQQELLVEVGNTLNQNIIQSGELISAVISANAAQLQDLESLQRSLVEQRSAEAERQQRMLNDLDSQLFEARATVDFAVQKYKSAVERWQAHEELKFGLEVATQLFNLSTAIAAPASSISAVKALGLTAQRIQKTLKVLNATVELYSGVTTGLDGLSAAQQTLDELQEASFDRQSLLTWDELPVQFNQIMATGPDVAEKSTLQSAFSIMIMRGKAVVSARASLHGVLRDLYQNQQRQQLNARQLDRFAALQHRLKPARVEALDVDNIDLVALTSQLAFVRNQMLTILGKAFLLQDQALQYTYLQPATPAPSASLLGFSRAVVQQHANTLAAKTALAPYQASRTQPIEIVISGIRPEALTQGNSLLHTLYLDNAAFQEYVDARVVAVVATVEGIKSTDSGNYLLRLACNGTPFHDRNLQRKAMSFHTPGRERIYSYRANDNVANFSDQGHSWSDGVSRITPFTNWEISLPASKVNAGLTFDRELLTVRLSFVLEARIVDAYGTRAPLARARLESGTAATSPTTSQSLLNQMFTEGPCTNNWDVVFNMRLDSINEALAAQYERFNTDSQFTNKFVYEKDEDLKHRPNAMTIRTNHLEFEYGYPKLEFSANDTSTVTVKMKISKGYFQTWERSLKHPEDPIEYNPKEIMDGETLTIGAIPLQKVSGSINKENPDGTPSSTSNTLAVTLALAEGVFNLDMDFSDTEAMIFNEELQNHFRKLNFVFEINRLDLSNVPTLNELKPNGFNFKVLKTPAGNEMLQLFIMTGDRPMLDKSCMSLNDIAEPLPDDQQCSLFVRSSLVFGSILPASLRSDNGWTLRGIDPHAAHTSWSTEFSQANLGASLDLSALNHTASVGGGQVYDCTYSLPNGGRITCSLAGTQLKAQANGQLHFTGSHKQAFDFFEIRSYHGHEKERNTCSTDVSLAVNAYLPLSVSGQGREQSIQISLEGKAITLDGHLSGGGPSGTDDLNAQVNQQCRDQLPEQVKRNLSFSFDPISVFALKNLLFPEKNYITFSACAVPGDLVLLGRFNKQP